MEFFAGSATLAQAMQERKFKTVALDIMYWQDYLQSSAQGMTTVPTTNPLDVLSASGFMRLF